MHHTPALVTSVAVRLNAGMDASQSPPNPHATEVKTHTTGESYQDGFVQKKHHENHKSKNSETHTRGLSKPASYVQRANPEQPGTAGSRAEERQPASD
jgi:hypothetical protein